MAASNLNNRIQNKAEKHLGLSRTMGPSVQLSTSTEVCPEQVLWNSFPGPSISLGRQALVSSQDFCINGIYVSFLNLQLWTSISSWDYGSLKKPSSVNKHWSESKLEPQPQAKMSTSCSNKGSHPNLHLVTSFTELQSSLPWEILFISPHLDNTVKTSKVHVILTSKITTQHVMWSNHFRPHFNNRTHLICNYCLIDGCKESTSIPA